MRALLFPLLKNSKSGVDDRGSPLTNYPHATSPFCIFLASFSLKHDVTDAILQDIEKIKVQCLMSLLFDFFEILQAVRSEQMNFA